MRGEAGGLIADDEALELGIRNQVAVCAWVDGHGWVHIEAVDWRIGGRFEVICLDAAVSMDDCGVEVFVAGVDRIGMAEPAGQIGVDGARIAGVGRVRGCGRIWASDIFTVAAVAGRNDECQAEDNHQDRALAVEKPAHVS